MQWWTYTVLVRVSLPRTSRKLFLKLQLDCLFTNPFFLPKQLDVNNWTPSKCETCYSAGRLTKGVCKVHDQVNAKRKELSGQRSKTPGMTAKCRADVQCSAQQNQHSQRCLLWPLSPFYKIAMCHMIKTCIQML